MPPDFDPSDLPYGMALTHDETELRRIGVMRRWRDAGQPPESIAAEFNDLAIPFRPGRPWTTEAVAGLLGRG